MMKTRANTARDHRGLKRRSAGLLLAALLPCAAMPAAQAKDGGQDGWVEAQGADFDGDRYRDRYRVNRRPSGWIVEVQVARQAGGWRPYGSLFVPSKGAGDVRLLTGDMDGDGKTDFVFVDDRRRVDIRFSLGRSAWTSRAFRLDLAADIKRSVVVAMDVNGDRKADLYLQKGSGSRGGANQALYLSTGRSGLTRSDPFIRFGTRTSELIRVISQLQLSVDLAKISDRASAQRQVDQIIDGLLELSGAGLVGSILDFAGALDQLRGKQAGQQTFDQFLGGQGYGGSRFDFTISNGERNAVTGAWRSFVQKVRSVRKDLGLDPADADRNTREAKEAQEQRDREIRRDQGIVDRATKELTRKDLSPASRKIIEKDKKDAEERLKKKGVKVKGKSKGKGQGKGKGKNASSPIEPRVKPIVISRRILKKLKRFGVIIFQPDTLDSIVYRDRLGLPAQRGGANPRNVNPNPAADSQGPLTNAQIADLIRKVAAKLPVLVDPNQTRPSNPKLEKLARENPTRVLAPQVNPNPAAGGKGKSPKPPRPGIVSQVSRASGATYRTGSTPTGNQIGRAVGGKATRR